MNNNDTLNLNYNLFNLNGKFIKLALNFFNLFDYSNLKLIY